MLYLTKSLEKPTFLCTFADTTLKFDKIMAITNEQAQLLIGIEKKILIDNSPVDSVSLQQEFPIDIRYHLIDAAEGNFEFLWRISQSSKNVIKLSLHVQDEDSNIGLLRIDYNGSHKNPEIAKEDLPERFLPYVGRWFTNESHIHYYVDGYRPLAWAIPIMDSSIETKTIEADKTETIKNAILEFAKLINVKTIINVQAMLI